MTVSVIIPVRNGERYLRACIDSVLAQTRSAFELVCVDDGSTDGTAAILDGYAAADARVRVLHEPPTDAGTCRNRGLSASTGEALVFLDADDVFAPRLLEILVGGLEDSRADVAMCSHVTFSGDGPVPQMPAGGAAAWTVRRTDEPGCDVFRGVSSCAWNKVFRRDLIERNGLRFLSSPSSNDFTFVIAAVAVSRRCAVTEVPLVAHRYHAASIQATRGKSPGCFFDAVRAFRCDMDRLGTRRTRPWVWCRFRAYYLEHLYWQFGTMRTRAAYAELRRLAVAAEPDLRIADGERLPTLLGRRRLRRYRMMMREASLERLWAWLERCLAPLTGDYELTAGLRRKVKRAVRWSVTLAFDPLLLLAKMREARE